MPKQGAFTACDKNSDGNVRKVYNHGVANGPHVRITKTADGEQAEVLDYFLMGALTSAQAYAARAEASARQLCELVRVSGEGGSRQQPLSEKGIAAIVVAYAAVLPF